MHLVAHPVPLALGPVAGFGLIGRLDQVGRGRHRFWVAQLWLPLAHGELRTPYAPEQVHGRELGQVLRCVGRRKGLQQPLAIGANGGRVRQARLPAAGQPIVFDAAVVALVPFGRREGP